MAERLLEGFGFIEETDEREALLEGFGFVEETEAAVGGEFDLILSHGSFSLSGQALNILFGRRIASSHGTFAITGNPLSLVLERLLGLSQGSYLLTGQDVTFNKGFTLVLVDGSYILTGNDLSFSNTYKISNNFGSYVLNGRNIVLDFSGAEVPEQPVVIPHFDPLAHFPDNLLPTPSRILLLIEFFVLNNRPPTPEEAIVLLGAGVDHGLFTDRLPDGFANRNWNNSKWLRKLVSDAGN